MHQLDRGLTELRASLDNHVTTVWTGKGVHDDTDVIGPLIENQLDLNAFQHQISLRTRRLTVAVGNQHRRLLWHTKASKSTVQVKEYSLQACGAGLVTSGHMNI